MERSEREYIFAAREGGAGEARLGRVSRRYISMKPRVSDRPIQAWGVRL